MNKKPASDNCILCLVNAAAYARPYFEHLAPHLKKMGYRVVFALDSHLTDVVYADNRELQDAWYFTDFVRNHPDSEWENANAGDLQWTPLFSDFDRFLTMEIEPPLRKDGPLKYEHIPAALRAFFNKIFETEAPAAVLYEPVSNSFAMAAHERAQAFGVPFLSLSPSRIPGRIEVSVTGALRDHETIGMLYRASRQGAVSNESRNMAREYIASIDAKIPDYMKTNGLDRTSLTKKYLNHAKIAHFLRGWRYRRLHPEDCALAYQHGDPVKLSLAYFRRSLKRRLRISSVLKHYVRNLPSENFLLYPLHFHPEASTSVWAADHVEELSNIQAISFRLPTNVKLYVKEHPSAVALQPVSFYKKLSALPNVRLLAPELPTKELVRKSLGVVCLTSTAGFEAAVLNKPVIVFGTVFYSYFPNVTKINGYSDLTKALDWALHYRRVAPEELVEATAAYIEYGSPGRFDFRTTCGDATALETVAKLIRQRLEAHLQQKVAAHA